ncbi:MAG: hypothetical protein WCI51_04340 [Lentisphaerota bacterium]
MQKITGNNKGILIIYYGKTEYPISNTEYPTDEGKAEYIWENRISNIQKRIKGGIQETNNLNRY